MFWCGLNGRSTFADRRYMRRMNTGRGRVGRVCLAVLGGVLALAAFATAPSPGAVAAASPGLVAAYGFDEGSGTRVADASGNGNSGTISNATWSTAGKYGGALQFNGSS